MNASAPYHATYVANIEGMFNLTETVEAERRRSADDARLTQGQRRDALRRRVRDKLAPELAAIAARCCDGSKPDVDAA